MGFIGVYIGIYQYIGGLGEVGEVEESGGREGERNGREGFRHRFAAA